MALQIPPLLLSDPDACLRWLAAELDVAVPDPAILCDRHAALRQIAASAGVRIDPLVSSSFDVAVNAVLSAAEPAGPVWLPAGASMFIDIENDRYFAGGSEVEYADIITDGLNGARAFKGAALPPLLADHTMVMRVNDTASGNYMSVAQYYAPASPGDGVIAIGIYDGGINIYENHGSVDSYDSLPPRYAENGLNILAWTITADRYARSMNGSTAVAASPTISLVRTDFSAYGTIHDILSITVYPTQLDADLPALSAVAAFLFIDQTDVAVSTLINSSWVLLDGITGSVSISVTGGQYQIADDDSGSNATAATAVTGTIAAGKWFRAVHTSSADPETAVNTVVTIGGLSDTFTSTTLAEEVPEWVPEGANLYADFDGEQFWDGEAEVTLAEFFETTTSYGTPTYERAFAGATDSLTIIVTFDRIVEGRNKFEFWAFDDPDFNEEDFAGGSAVRTRVDTSNGAVADGAAIAEGAHKVAILATPTSISASFDGGATLVSTRGGSSSISNRMAFTGDLHTIEFRDAVAPEGLPALSAL